MLSSKLPCAHCGKSVDLVNAHFRSPRFGARWWEFGEETSRYRCPACQGINRVTLHPAAVAILLVLAVTVALGWWHFEFNKQLLITVAAVGAIVIVMKGWALAKD